MTVLSLLYDPARMRSEYRAAIFAWDCEHLPLDPPQPGLLRKIQPAPAPP